MISLIIHVNLYSWYSIDLQHGLPIIPLPPPKNLPPPVPIGDPLRYHDDVDTDDDDDVAGPRVLSRVTLGKTLRA